MAPEDLLPMDRVTNKTKNRPQGGKGGKPQGGRPQGNQGGPRGNFNKFGGKPQGNKFQGGYKPINKGQPFRK